MKIYHFGAEDAPVLLLLPDTDCCGGCADEIL